MFHKSLIALTLLSEGYYNLEQLADKMCATKRHVQKILKSLKSKGINVQYQFSGRTKYFSISPESSLLSAVLSPAEQAAINAAFTSGNTSLQSAAYKLIQLALIQLSFKHKS